MSMLLLLLLLVLQPQSTVDSQELRESQVSSLEWYSVLFCDRLVLVTSSEDIHIRQLTYLAST